MRHVKHLHLQKSIKQTFKALIIAIAFAVCMELNPGTRFLLQSQNLLPYKYFLRLGSFE